MGNCNTKCSYCEHRNPSDHSDQNCEAPATCTCKCCVGGDHDVAQKTAAITAGVGLTALGIAVCIFSGGLAAPFVGAAVAGAGFSSAANGITKAATGEKMDACDFLIDVGVGAGTSVIMAGGSSLAASAGKAVAKETAKVSMKVAAKTAVMTGAGFTQSLAAETCEWGMKPTKSGEPERKFNGHSLWVGSVVGGLGSAGSSLSKGAANKVGPCFEKGLRGVSKSATRVAGEAITGTAKGAVLATGKMAAGQDDKFCGHDLWAGALTGGVSSVCNEGTKNLVKAAGVQKLPENRSKGNSTRAVIRTGSAFVETTGNELIEQGRQAAIGKDDETRHFGKHFSTGLLKSIKEKHGRFSEKFATRRSQRKSERRQ